MFNTLKDYFESILINKEKNSDDMHSLELSAAVLMVEIALADSKLENGELAVIEKMLNENFNLSLEETRDLIRLGKDEVDHATSLYEYTRALNEKLKAGEKTRIVEMLWRVAAADVVIDKYEEYFIRKIADLLYVPHAEFIRAKHNAMGE